MLTRLAQDVRATWSALVGSPEARRGQRAHRRAADDVAHRLREIEARWGRGEADPEESPVFVLAAGWRSGSTLVQRWLMTDPELLIWGEAFARSNLVPTMLHQLRGLSRDWPLEEYRVPEDISGLSGAWVANLYPPVPELLGAHRAFFRRLLAQPAAAYGAPRWGLKEVRWGLDEARYLRFLFPGARIIFLYREPVAAFRSFRNAVGSEYARWPRQLIATPRAFLRHWRRRVREFRAGAEEVDACLVRYEDLIADPQVQERVARYAGADVVPLDTLARIPGKGARQPGAAGRKKYLPLAERLLVRMFSGSVR